MSFRALSIRAMRFRAMSITAMSIKAMITHSTSTVRFVLNVKNFSFVASVFRSFYCKN